MVQWPSLRVAVPSCWGLPGRYSNLGHIFALLEHHFFIYAMELVQSALLIRVPYYVTGKVWDIIGVIKKW